MTNARKQLADLRDELNAIATVQSNEVMEATDRYYKLVRELEAKHGREAVQAAMNAYFDSDEWRADYRRMIANEIEKLRQQRPIDRVKLANFEDGLKKYDEDCKRIAKLESEAANVQ